MRDVVARFPVVADDEEPQSREVERAGGPGGPLVGRRRFRAAQRQPKREGRATPRALAGRRQGSPVEIRKMARYGESQAKLPAGAIALLGARLRPVREAVEQVGQDVGGDPNALVPHP